MKTSGDKDGHALLLGLELLLDILDELIIPFKRVGVELFHILPVPVHPHERLVYLEGKAVHGAFGSEEIEESPHTERISILHVVVPLLLDEAYIEHPFDDGEVFVEHREGPLVVILEQRLTHFLLKGIYLLE